MKNLMKRYPSTILATACLPWKNKNVFDQEVFARQVKLLIESNVKHIYLFGTAGEGYALTDEEFEHVVSIFADIMKGEDLFPMVGIISLSLGTMLKRIKIARGYGISDFMFTLPCWGELSITETNGFFHELCDPFPDCRFLHYNTGRAKRIIGPAEYESLAFEIPNFCGAKITTDSIHTVNAYLNKKMPLQLFFGDIVYGYARMFDECGLLIAMALSNLDTAWNYFYSAKNRDFEKVNRYQSELGRMSEKLTELTKEPKIDGAYDKFLAKLADPDFSLSLLPPYNTNTEGSFNKYKEYLIETFPHWIK